MQRGSRGISYTHLLQTSWINFDSYHVPFLPTEPSHLTGSFIFTARVPTVSRAPPSW